MSAKSLSVLIVGCGGIAGIFDQYRQSSDLPLTHAGAFSRDDRFNIVACVEPDDNRRGEFMKFWNILKGYSSIDEVASSGKTFDIISICSPTVNHAYNLEFAIQIKPKLIFCEKPITTSLSETKELVNKCKKDNILLAVNYTRRWDLEILKVQLDIQSGRRGQLRSVTGNYNKGILNNGSHMLDLLNFLVGPLKIVKVGKPLQDFFPDDPTIPVWLEGYKGLPIHLACGHAEDYSLFDLQMVFSNSILSMEDGGMYWRERQVINSDIFKDYKKLDDGIRRVGEYPRAMLQAIENIYGAINEGMPLASTGESAIVVQQLCEQIKHLTINT